MSETCSSVKENKPHILVVDDEPLNREIIEFYLENKGYELSFASNGAEALEILKSVTPYIDVLLLDRMMPVMTGLELLKIIQQDSLLKNIPVILQTARSTKEDIKEGIDAGAYFYLTKPFEEEVLVSMVQSAVAESKKILRIQQSLVESVMSAGMINYAQFQFQLLDEAQALAIYLAGACPEPEKVIFGLSELFINAVEHGNVGITYDEKSELDQKGKWRDEVNRRLALPENKNKFVDVSFQRNKKNITIIIKDKGKGFDWGKYMEFSPERVFDTHGRGIASSNLMSLDNLHYNDEGNEVTAVISLDKNRIAVDDEELEMV
ncbi:MAG: response regulator [Gammaproteobacteria bacterium]